MMMGANAGTDLDSRDRRLLEAIQQSVPLVARPFEALAAQLDLTEADVLARLHRIREQGIISRMSAVFDTRSLGYESVLVAARVAPEKVEQAAAVINEHPGVSHNYLRTADYNLWFTLAVPPDSQLGLEKTAARLAALAGAASYRLLPATRVFKIGVKLPLAESDAELPAASPEQACREQSKALVLTSASKAAILALQEDLPIETRPFDAIAARHGLSVEQMLAAGRDLQAAGVMRRYAAVLRHRKIGFAVNCMTVWHVPDERVEEVGAALVGFAEVTHCYLRPAWTDWPYNLYAMVHCRSDQQCRNLVTRMKSATGIDQIIEVYSTREFKKVRLEYFSPAFEEWEGRNT
jgi:siroheme decarboxylase